MLRATTACNFSSLISPDVSAPAALASLLFNPPEPQNHEKHNVSRLSYLFAHLHLHSSDLFSSDSSPCWLLFHLSILSEVWLPNFLRLYLVCICLYLYAAISYMSNGSSVQIGADWESWVATCGPNHRPVKMPVKFGCSHGIYVLLLTTPFFGIMLKKRRTQENPRLYCPKCCFIMMWKIHPVGTSPINPRLENKWHAGSEIGAKHGRIWENHVKDKKHGHTFKYKEN